MKVVITVGIVVLGLAIIWLYFFNKSKVKPEVKTEVKPEVSEPIKTRGETQNETLGTLSSSDHSKVLPLFGKPLHSRSSRWSYFTRTDSFNVVSLAIQYEGKDCTDTTIGCNELYDGDKVFIDEFNDTFTVKLYKKNITYTPL